MKGKKKFWKLPVAVGVAAFTFPSIGAAHDSASEHMRGEGYGQYDYAPGEFFTQAERDLVERVKANLEPDRSLEDTATNITISAKQGTVRLSGAVPSEQDKDRIGGRVERTLGVENVENDLRVAEARSDMGRDVTRSVGERGARSAATGAQSGASPSLTQQPLTSAQRAELAAPAPPPPTDRQLRVREQVGSFPATGDRAQAAVGERQQTGSGGMHETDRTGATGPSGTRSFTPNSGAIDDPARAAKPAGDYAVTALDRSVAARVRNSLTGNPALGATQENIHIKVDNGHVILHGWVNSQQEKEQITSQVRGLDGVQELDNQLQVWPREQSRLGAD